MRKPRFSAQSELPCSACLKRAHVTELCRFDMPFVLNLVLPPAPHVVAFGAQGNHAISLAFELEEPRRAAAVFVPRQPVLFFGLEFRSQSRADEGLEAGARQRHVAAVRVHLEQLVVPPVHVPVEEVIVELEHALLG